jgi:hypothetical protein
VQDLILEVEHALHSRFLSRALVDLVYHALDLEQGLLERGVFMVLIRRRLDEGLCLQTEEDETTSAQLMSARACTSKIQEGPRAAIRTSSKSGYLTMR